MYNRRMLLCKTIGQKYPPTCCREGSKSVHTGPKSPGLSQARAQLGQDCDLCVSLVYEHIAS